MKTIRTPALQVHTTYDAYDNKSSKALLYAYVSYLVMLTGPTQLGPCLSRHIPEQYHQQGR